VLFVILNAENKLIWRNANQAVLPSQKSKRNDTQTHEQWEYWTISQQITGTWIWQRVNDYYMRQNSRSVWAWNEWDGQYEFLVFLAPNTDNYCY